MFLELQLLVIDSLRHRRGLVTGEDNVAIRTKTAKAAL